MIAVKTLVPEVYYNHSRDFQLLSKLYEVVFNAIKTNADHIYGIPLSISEDPVFLELLASTLGFKSKHHYPTNQLKAICESFSSLLKEKGTIKSIKDTLQILLNAEGIDSYGEVNIKGDKLEVNIPPLLKDTTLFKDLLDYLLPAGVSCSIYKAATVSAETATTITQSSDSIKRENIVKKSSTLSVVYKYGESGTPGSMNQQGENAKIDNTLVVPYEP